MIKTLLKFTVSRKLRAHNIAGFLQIAKDLCVIENWTLKNNGTYDMLIRTIINRYFQTSTTNEQNGLFGSKDLFHFREGHPLREIMLMFNWKNVKQVEINILLGLV